MRNLTNAPVEIMRIPVTDGTVKRDKPIKATALPMLAAMEWTEEADMLSASLLSAKTQAERVEAITAILECVCDYDETFPAADIRSAASAQQVSTAFEILRELNDPLAVAREKQEAKMTKDLALLEKLGGPDKMKELIEKHVSAAVSDSQNGSIVIHSEL